MPRFRTERRAVTVFGLCSPPTGEGYGPGLPCNAIDSLVGYAPLTIRHPKGYPHPFFSSEIAHDTAPAVSLSSATHRPPRRPLCRAMPAVGAAPLDLPRQWDGGCDGGRVMVRGAYHLARVTSIFSACDMYKYVHIVETCASHGTRTNVWQT